MKINSIKKFIFDLFFPRFCINCGKEGSYLCQDCFYLIEILEEQYCPFCLRPKVVSDGKTCNYCKSLKKLTGLFCAASYDNFIVKKMINQFKYEPYIKDAAEPLSSLIISHLTNLNKGDNFQDFILIPVPLEKRKLKKRGFNQAEEIAKELSKNFKIPVFNNTLIKTKSTPAQVELEKTKRQENIKGVFSCQKIELIKNKKILLIDDVFTTGATLEECARILKEAGAKEVWGMVVARG